MMIKKMTPHVDFKKGLKCLNTTIKVPKVFCSTNNITWLENFRYQCNIIIICPVLPCLKKYFILLVLLIFNTKMSVFPSIRLSGC